MHEYTWARAFSVVGIWACVTVGVILVTPWVALGYVPALLATFFVAVKQEHK